MPDNILDAVNLMVDGSGKTIKTIAEEIGKPYSALKRELNEFDDLAKLGADLLYPLMVACDGNQPLEYLADRRGFNLTKRKGREIMPARPVALISAASRLLTLQEDANVSRIELVQAANQVIEEAEAVVYSRFPHQVAFSKSRRIQSDRLPWWCRIFRRR